MVEPRVKTYVLFLGSFYFKKCHTSDLRRLSKRASYHRKLDFIYARDYQISIDVPDLWVTQHIHKFQFT